MKRFTPPLSQWGPKQEYEASMAKKKEAYQDLFATFSKKYEDRQSKSPLVATPISRQINLSVPGSSHTSTATTTVMGALIGK